ncbi:hypothetical protein ACNKHV_14495 [Shigella flexneri]
MGAGLKTFGHRRRWLCGLAALVTAFIGVDFFANGEQSYSQPLWTWMSVGDLTSVLTWCWTACADRVSVVMVSGFLIHMYASW